MRRVIGGPPKIDLPLTVTARPDEPAAPELRPAQVVEQKLVGVLNQDRLLDHSDPAVGARLADHERRLDLVQLQRDDAAKSDLAVIARLDVVDLVGRVVDQRRGVQLLVRRRNLLLLDDVLVVGVPLHLRFPLPLRPACSFMRGGSFTA